VSRSNKSIRLDEVDQAGLYIVERNKEGYRVRRILAVNIYARGFIPSSCCCVRYSNADIESWVNCVEFVDGASEDAIASPTTQRRNCRPKDQSKEYEVAIRMSTSPDRNQRAS
jgi:hypothetical protein